MPRRSRRGLGGGAGGAYRWWGYAALALLAITCVVLVAAVIVKTRNDAAIAAREASSYTPPPLTAPSPSATSSLPIVSVVGDQFTSGTSADSGTKAEWPALLGAAAKADVKTIAAAGAGYVAAGEGGATLVSEAAKVDPASKVVVLFGGANDQSSSPLSLAKAATKAISAAGTRAPDAKIVVVGPASALATPPQSLLTVRDTLKSAASIGHASWVDPITEDWLSSSSSLTNADGQPTDQGQKVLESKFEAVLRTDL